MDTKFSEFPSATVLNGVEQLVGLQGGLNKKASLSLIREFIRGCKEYYAIASKSGAVITVTHEDKSDFGATTFALANPSNGLITLTASSPVFTAGKTAGIGVPINNAGTVHFMAVDTFSTTVVSFKIFLHDGTALSTPNFSDIPFIVRVSV